jgi:hypothetical protein
MTTMMMMMMMMANNTMMRITTTLDLSNHVVRCSESKKNSFHPQIITGTIYESANRTGT